MTEEEVTLENAVLETEVDDQNQFMGIDDRVGIRSVQNRFPNRTGPIKCMFRSVRFYRFSIPDRFGTSIRSVLRTDIFGLGYRSCNKSVQVTPPLLT